MPFPNQHAVRVVQPGRFTDGSFRTITIKPGITAIVGRLQGETSTTVQAYRFDAKKFTPEQARQWLKDNSIKVALFEKATGKEDDGARFAETNWFDIFQAGDRGLKGKYSKSDLNDMVDAINNGEHIVPIVIGHETDPMNKWDTPLPSELADGKVNQAKVEGDIIKAKASVSERVKHFWDDNRLTSASVGVYKNFKNTGKKAIRHLAFLGKTPPAIKGLDYKPQFLFSDDEQNGEFDEVIFSQTNDDGIPTPSRGDNHMTLEEALAKIEQLERENKSRDTVAFDELKKEHDDNVVDFEKAKKERDEEKARADKAEAELKKTNEKAAFAEIKTGLLEEIKSGLPKDLHDTYRAQRAHELGLVDDNGLATFAEGKTSDEKPTDLLKKLREAKRVPLKSEGHKAAKKTKVTFSEDEIEEAQAERMKLTDERLEEMKKTNENTTFEEAASQIMEENPDLYPDM